jgi:hypothetical protein
MTPMSKKLKSNKRRAEKVREQLGFFPPSKKPLTSNARGNKEKKVFFRSLAKDIPSTTYGTFRLYNYPAKFIPQVIDFTLKHYSKPGVTVLDPFAGCGTVGLVSRLNGHNYELWDINPMLKVLHSIAVMKPIKVEVDPLIRSMKTSREEFLPQWSRITYWFPEKFLPLLYKVWGYYHSLENSQTKKLLLIPLLKTTGYYSYNDPQRQKLSKSPHSKKRILSLLKSDWESLFYQMVAKETKTVQRKLIEYQNLNPKSVKAVVRGGVDALYQRQNHDGWNILITSPPYLQAQEYIRSSKTDLFWLGFSEKKVREFGRKEFPYRDVESCPIYSETYHRFIKDIHETHLRKIFENYFHGVLGALTKLQKKVQTHLFLFVGPATIRTRPVPIDKIFSEHFTALKWIHTETLVDTIVSRVMFSSKVNPATGLKDVRMTKENLVILEK